MIDNWRELIWRAAAMKSFTTSGVRKIVADLSFEMEWDDLIGANHAQLFGYTDLCYTKSKETQLLRNYWNQEGFEVAFEKLQARKHKDHTSVAITMKGQKKDSRSQGYCMQSLVISMCKEDLTVDIYYRSTELVQKFAADLVFFSTQLPRWFEQLGRNPSVVRMKFSNAYISAVFMPILMRYEPKPLSFFEHLKKHDPKFYRTCGLASRRLFDETHNYSYRTRVKMFDYWKEHVDPKKVAPLGKLLAGLKGDITETDDGDDE